MVRSGEEICDDLFGDPWLDAAVDHPATEPLECGLEVWQLAAVSHRPPELIGLCGGEATEFDRDRHRLFLEDRDPLGPAQDRLECRVRIGHRLESPAAEGIGPDEAGLDRARPDQCDLDDEVVEAFGPGLEEWLDLCSTLDLEGPDDIATADHLVGLRVILW